MVVLTGLLILGVSIPAILRISVRRHISRLALLPFQRHPRVVSLEMISKRVGQLPSLRKASLHRCLERDYLLPELRGEYKSSMLGEPTLEYIHRRRGTNFVPEVSIINSSTDSGGAP